MLKKFSFSTWSSKSCGCIQFRLRCLGFFSSIVYNTVKLMFNLLHAVNYVKSLANSRLDCKYSQRQICILNSRLTMENANSMRQDLAFSFKCYFPINLEKEVDLMKAKSSQTFQRTIFKGKNTVVLESKIQHFLKTIEIWIQNTLPKMVLVYIL